MTKRVRIATRGSRLALAQSEWVAARIREARPDWITELVVIRTSGDQFTSRPLKAIGGKGLFVKEIQEALLAGEVECAVHSAKDLPAQSPPELVIAAVPAREDPRDVLVTQRGGSLEALPAGSVVGTSSPRRAALLRWLRPDVQVVPLRGNVETRLEKLERRQADGLVLAAAGLRRLRIWDRRCDVLSPELFVPAVGQGALVVETRADSWATDLAFLHDVPSGWALAAERAFLAAIGGSCHTSLGAYAVVEDGSIKVHGAVADAEGRQVFRAACTGHVEEAPEVGARLAQQLLACGAQRVLGKEPVEPIE
ncbi:MAG: porphobilinogen deaminase [Candidatus Binatia bacterium]|nr:MAG: porphobilinogen deaminase [Candidatus Binatia bacterium]